MAITPPRSVRIPDVLWKKANLLSRDGIHYSKDGYIHQGNLLTKAIINAYNKYVSTR
jgi:hypothetical protein